MSICFLTHLAAYDPDLARQRILAAAITNEGKTRPTAKALGVSYCTLLRLLDRLEIRAQVRSLWAQKRREHRETGKK